MLMTKLTKVHKACRKHGGPVLDKLAEYVEHVLVCLDLADEGDARFAEYRNAVASLDLSAMIQARDAMAAPQTESNPTAPPTEASPDAGSAPASEARTERAARKGKKNKGKTQPVPVVAEPCDAAADPPEEIVAVSSAGKVKKAKGTKKVNEKAAKTH